MPKINLFLPIRRARAVGIGWAKRLEGALRRLRKAVRKLRNALKK
jgi:hypothetical protein